MYDEAPVPTAAQDDLDDDLPAQFLPTPKGIDLRQLLVNRRILAEGDAATLQPTVAGPLCFSKDPAQHVPGAYMRKLPYIAEPGDIPTTLCIRKKYAGRRVFRLRRRPGSWSGSCSSRRARTSAAGLPAVCAGCGPRGHRQRRSTS